MAELGVARLVVVADTRQALQALDQLRSRVSTGVGNVGDGLFKDIEAKATAAGISAGTAFKQGFDAASKTQKLKFENFTEALEFNPKNTIKGLSEYLTALRELRDSSELGWVSTQKLTDRIGALDSALQRSKRTTAEASEEQRQFNQALESSQTKREAEEARALAEAAKQAANAQRESAAASKASADAAKQNASQLQQLIAGYRSLTSVTGAAAGVAGSVGRGIGAVGRGVGAAAKGAVKAGKFGYELGAEFGVFEAPRTGPIKQAIQQVIDRFKFLGEQALTARGAVLRSIEAVGTLAVGNKVVDNIDLIKLSLAGIDVSAKAASGGLNILKNTLGAGFNFVGDKLPNNAIGDLSKLIGETIDASAGLGSAGKAFTDFATSGLASGLDGLQAFQQALQNIPPEAQAAALALAGLAAGAISNQTNVSINDIAEALDRVRNNALNVAQALKQINGPTELVMQQNTALQGSGLTDEERQQRARNAARLQALRQFIQEFGAEQRKLAQLALPSSEMLAEGGRRIQRLTPTGLNESNEAQVAALRQSAEEASKLAAAERVAQGEQTQLNAALEAGFRVLQQMVPIIEEQTQGYKAQTAELSQQLQLLQEKRATEQQRANDARRRLEEDAQRRAEERQAANARRARQEAIETGLLGQSSPISGRLPGGGFIPGSPADLKRRADRRQEAASNALIGGAFPLLFGQGLGASIGGGLGGFAGGLKGGQFGFGLSLLGTAVGAQFDQASQKLQTLGQALDNPIGKFGELQQAGLISSKGLEKQIQSLIDTGRTAEAAALIQKDLANTYGDLATAKELADSTDKLNRAWSQLGVTLASVTAGPVAGFIKAVSAAIGAPQSQPQGVTAPSVTAGSFDKQIGDIQFDPRFGREQAARILTRRNQLINDIAQSRRAQGLSQEGVGEQANAQALDEARQLGVYSRETEKAQKEYEQSVRRSTELRNKLLQITLRQFAAEAQGNTVAQAGLKFDEIRLRYLEQIDRLKAEGKPIIVQTGPNQFEVSPEVRKAQQDAATQRQQLAESAAAAAAQSERELAAARQLIGLEGDRLTIRKEQQRVDEAQRQFAQADSAFRERFGNTDKSSLSQQDQIEWQALYDRRRALENDLTRIRLGAYAEIEAAERRLAQERQKVQSDIAIAQRGNTITDVGRGALQGVDDLKRQIEEVKRLRDVAVSRPGNFDLAQQADDAGQKLRLAGLDLRNSLQESARQAELTVRSITRSIEDARTALAAARGGTEGVNKFIQPQQATDRQVEANRQLFAQANELAQQLGVVARFSGSLTDQNRQMTEFIQAARAEIRGTQDIGTQEEDLVQAQADLAAVNQSLVSVNQKLSEAIGPLTTEINSLVNKDWSVNVNVNQKGGVTTSGPRYNPTF